MTLTGNCKRIMCLSFVPSFSFLPLRFYRNVCLPRTSLTLPSMFTGLAPLESLAVTVVANAGISLSTVMNVQLPCQLMASCTSIHRVNNIEGHCNNIHKGMVCVGFWVTNFAGYRENADVLGTNEPQFHAPCSRKMAGFHVPWTKILNLF